MILTNIACNNRLLWKDNDIYVWTADSPKGDKYLAIFNAREGDQPEKVTVKLSQLGFSKTVSVKELWQGKNLGKVKDEFSTLVPKHGVGLFKLK